MERTFPGLTGKVTAAFEYRGEEHVEHVELLSCPVLSSRLFSSPGFAYIYSGPQVFEYSLASQRLLRVLDNNYFLPCSPP